MVVHTFNSSTQEAEPGGSLSLRLTWSTKQVRGTASATQRDSVLGYRY